MLWQAEPRRKKRVPMKAFEQRLELCGSLTGRRNWDSRPIAILTLALGIGAKYRDSAVVNTVLLRPLDFRNPSSLYILSGQNVQKGTNGTNLGYTYIGVSSRPHTVFENFAVFAHGCFQSCGLGYFPNSFRPFGSRLLFFDCARRAPCAGTRVSQPEDRQGAAPVIVLGHDLWMHPGSVEMQTLLGARYLWTESAIRLLEFWK